jgi:hypothetical protein
MSGFIDREESKLCGLALERTRRGGMGSLKSTGRIDG